MAILIMADNVGIGCSGGVFRSIILETAAALHKAGHSELALWLTSGASPVQMFTELDARDLTPSNRVAFQAAIGAAFDGSKERCEELPHRRAGREEYLKLLVNLLAQIDSVAAGVRPCIWPNLSGIPSHDGCRNGPGWTT